MSVRVTNAKAANSLVCGSYGSGRQDLNLRPLDPQCARACAAIFCKRAFLVGFSERFELSSNCLPTDFELFPDIVLPQIGPNYLRRLVERFVLSIKSECLDRMVLLGEAPLRPAVYEYIDYYQTERPH